MTRKRIISGEIINRFGLKLNFLKIFLYKLIFQVDFAVEHASCSRVHALLLYHGLLQRFALIDMDSSMYNVEFNANFQIIEFSGHGTFLGNVRLRPLEVVFMDPGTQFHLGASTRKYSVRLKTEHHVEDDPTVAASDEQLDVGFL